MQDDAALFRQFASQNSEEAFAELVRRHVDLVYSAALRRVAGHSGLAQDIAQKVFSDLARKAHSLPPGTVLVAWLHRATQFASAAAVRAETRRIAREQQAAAMQSLEQSDGAPAWDSIQPVLDEVLDSLEDRDRAALLLRFFRQHSFREVGSALGVSEDAARMRVGRALDKLRDLLAARGVTTTAAALSAALATQAVQAAPFGLAATLAGAALIGGASSVSTSTVGLINIMTSTKLASGFVTLLAIAAATTAVIEHRRLAAYRLENDALRQENGSTPSHRPTR
jgi:RNA polymerase sigma factor (sigma-70 family)